MKTTKNNTLNLDKSQISRLKKFLGITKIEDIELSVLKEFKECLKELTDSRQQSKITYKIWDVAMYVILANFSAIYDWDDIHDFIVYKRSWLRSFLLMTGGIPTAETIENIVSIIEPKEFENILNAFYLSMVHSTNKKDMINLDGRVDRGSARNETDFYEKCKPLNVLNAYSNQYGICLASERIDDKTNEIPTIPVILERFNVKDTIITWDALNTQKENVKCVVDKKGDYVVPIKANQGNFYNDLDLYFNDLKLEQIIIGNTNSAYLKEIEKSHSSSILYEYYQTSDVSWYFDYKEWKKLTTIGLVKKTILKNNKTTIEKRYYISNLDVDINSFANAIRNHWSVENKLHWHLDFTFREDKNTTKNKQALMNLQLVNKFTLAILNKVKPFYGNKSIQRIRKNFSMNYELEFPNMLCYLAFS